MKVPKDNTNLRRQISQMDPHKSRRFGREIIRRPDWSNELALKIMEFALRHKFQEGTSWHSMLLQTGEEEIVEFNNWRDVFWGFDIFQGKGDNHLGQILMKLRVQFQNQCSGKGIMRF
jgi:predicted NAD-dependent protein-ADP-ribosyltransferase YbiA (DUF1768 family)